MLRAKDYDSVIQATAISRLPTLLATMSWLPGGRSDCQLDLSCLLLDIKGEPLHGPKGLVFYGSEVSDCGAVQHYQRRDSNDERTQHIEISLPDLDARVMELQLVTSLYEGPKHGLVMTDLEKAVLTIARSDDSRTMVTTPLPGEGVSDSMIVGSLVRLSEMHWEWKPIFRTLHNGLPGLLQESGLA